MKIPTFLKWAGGKRRLLSQMDSHLPKKIDRYFEPFLGAGSVFFYIKQKYNPSFCMISDINRDLVEAFKAVRDSPSELIRELKKWEKINSKEEYYLIRSKFNEKKYSGLKRCAAFIYLNKRCFNGLYRVNSKGEFNVPYRGSSNSSMFDKETILFASKLLQGVVIKCQDYSKLRVHVERGDFIYLDPCYDPLKKTSFANYTPKRFCDADSERLSCFVAEMGRRGVRVLFSNNVTDGVKARYPLSKGFVWEKVYCPRSINSVASKRGAIQELLIRNY
jgi:DNA adenine methylase